MKLRIFILFSLFIANTCLAQNKNVTETNKYVAALKKVTDVMVIDVASPVAASRYYAYITLTSYECISVFNNKLNPSFSGYINGYDNIQIDAKLLNESDAKLAGILSIYKSGQKLLPSGYLLDKDIALLKKKYIIDKQHEIKFKQTSHLVDVIIDNIISYAKKDGFNKLNNLPRYINKDGDGYWKQTPPTFMLPVEPHWNTIRTFLLDSAQQFKPAAPIKYDTTKNSDFYKLAYEVYESSLQQKTNQKNVALFWDCNPFAMQRIGHIEFGLKKISPGGHWIGITGIACKKLNTSIDKTALTHVLVSLSMADAFIACWDEKYRSNRVRPETVIQNLIDRRWKPLLQTPPFPEYVSGHSVVSNTAADILTQIFGDNFNYLDDTEVEFGLPSVKFSSFNNAAAEASISRLYGGIHFRDAIEQGNILGKKVAVLSKSRLGMFFERIQSIPAVQ
jgi:hypothetical protein